MVTWGILTSGTWEHLKSGEILTTQKKKLDVISGYRTECLGMNYLGHGMAHKQLI